jgi:hypothetical protein
MKNDFGIRRSLSSKRDKPLLQSCRNPNVINFPRFFNRKLALNDFGYHFLLKSITVNQSFLCYSSFHLLFFSFLGKLFQELTTFIIHNSQKCLTQNHK